MHLGFGNMNVVYRRVWNIVDLKCWGTGNVLGQCGNEFWVNTNSRRTLSVQDSLPHEFTRADSFRFIGVLLACVKLILHLHFTYFFNIRFLLCCLICVLIIQITSVSFLKSVPWSINKQINIQTIKWNFLLLMACDHSEKSHLPSAWLGGILWALMTCLKSVSFPWKRG